MMHGQKT